MMKLIDPRRCTVVPSSADARELTDEQRTAIIKSHQPGYNVQNMQKQAHRDAWLALLPPLPFGKRAQVIPGPLRSSEKPYDGRRALLRNRPRLPIESAPELHAAREQWANRERVAIDENHPKGIKSEDTVQIMEYDKHAPPSRCKIDKSVSGEQQKLLPLKSALSSKASVSQEERHSDEYGLLEKKLIFLDKELSKIHLNPEVRKEFTVDRQNVQRRMDRLAENSLAEAILKHEANREEKQRRYLLSDDS